MTAENIVRNEIYMNVSQLVHELSDNPSYVDELLDVMALDDYRGPLVDFLNNHASEDDLDHAAEMAGTGGSASHIVAALDDNEVHVLADDLGVDPETDEALQHFAVSDWLADKLEGQGEMVLRDFLGMNIWGRTTAGQAIYMDPVIQRIANSL